MQNLETCASVVQTFAVDDVAVALALGAGSQRGEVGAGVGLAEALAPDLLGVQHPRQVALLLGLGALRDQGRAEHAEGEDVDRRRRAGLDQRFAQEQLLHQAGALAAVLDRPVEPDVAGVEHLLLPGAALVDRVTAGVVTGRTTVGPRHVRLVGLQPGGRLVLELALLGSQVEIHGRKG